MPTILRWLTAHLNLEECGARRSLHRRRRGGHYLARHGQSGVAKAAIISAVPPLM